MQIRRICNTKKFITDQFRSRKYQTTEQQLQTTEHATQTEQSGLFKLNQPKTAYWNTGGINARNTRTTRGGINATRADDEWGTMRGSEKCWRNPQKYQQNQCRKKPPLTTHTPPNNSDPQQKHSTSKQHENQTSRTKKQERDQHLTRWIRKNRLDGADEKTKWGKRKVPGPSERIQSVW